MSRVHGGRFGQGVAGSRTIRPGDHSIGDEKLAGFVELNGYVPNREERRAIERAERKRSRRRP